MDLDIFSAFSSRCPLVRMERGHLLESFCQMAVWLYKAKLRWLLIRSLPDVCKPQPLFLPIHALVHVITAGPNASPNPQNGYAHTAKAC